MEVNIEYKAKDGKVFSDPYLCESYEKVLEKEPGTLGQLLQAFKQFKETDYFSGIIYYRENGNTESLVACTVDFSDLYEGELVTQAMKDAQNRVRITVGKILNFFKDKDYSIPCSGSFLISPNMNLSGYTIIHLSNNKVFEQE